MLGEFVEHISSRGDRIRTQVELQASLLSGSNEVQSLRGGYFDYGGSDEDYDGDAR